jgi:hypothetical protein
MFIEKSAVTSCSPIKARSADPDSYRDGRTKAPSLYPHRSLKIIEARATPEEWHVYRTKAPLPTRAADQRKTFFTIKIINNQ